MLRVGSVSRRMVSTIHVFVIHRTTSLPREASSFFDVFNKEDLFCECTGSVWVLPQCGARQDGKLDEPV